MTFLGLVCILQAGPLYPSLKLISEIPDTSKVIWPVDALKEKFALFDFETLAPLVTNPTVTYIMWKVITIKVNTFASIIKHCK